MLSEQKMKNTVKKVIKETGLPPQQVFGLFGMEQLLKKLSKTEYQDKFILKAGYLLASKFGLDTRATKDLDTTIQKLSLTKEQVERMVDILTVPDEDGEQHFFLKTINKTREDFEYNGFNLKLIFFCITKITTHTLLKKHLYPMNFLGMI